MLFNKCNVSGVVILYNSEIEVISNLKTYLTQIDHLFVVDNSEEVNTEINQSIESLSNVTYIYNNCNMGVAYALNQAANMAIIAGYHFLLTMDDDTSVPEKSVESMLTYINQYGSERLGIVAGQPDSRLFGSTIESVSYAITSGSLLNLSAYKKCGPFLDELFIDSVDHEYCFRLIKKKYKIIEMNNIHLVHKLGERKQLILLEYKFPIYWVSHSPLRVYYKTRNCIFVLKSYSFLSMSIKITFCKEILKDFVKIVFLEDSKKNRLSFFVTAVFDAFKGRLGKKINTIQNA